MPEPARNGDARFRGLLVDLDGTLLDDDGRLPDENRDALRELASRGLHVLVATGRSEAGTQPILEQLGLDTPALVYNGAGLWCPREQRYLEERTLADEARDAAIDFALEHEALVVAMRYGEKVALLPSSEIHGDALRSLEQLAFVEREGLYLERAIRIMVASHAWEASAGLAEALEERIARPVYTAHFPLSVLPHLRTNPMHVCDVQAPCRGKAEGLRWLTEEHGVLPADVVCVGDARNDLEMLAKAGLGVAMKNAMPEVLAAADRVIGDNNEAAVAQLCRELWP